MKKLISAIVILAFSTQFLLGQDLTGSFSAENMRERVKRLSADDFEGRGPGTAGGRRAAQYIADQMKKAGIAPASRTGYFQNVPLVGLKADPNMQLEITGSDGSQSFKFGDDFVASTGAQNPNISISADLVFVGYGIDAPQYKWNDYKGNPDEYKGKILVMIVNDPP